MKKKLRYSVYNIQPLVLILRQINSVHASPSHILKIRFKIILSSMPRSFKFSLPFAFTHQNPVRTSPLPPYALHAPPTSLLLIWLPE